jgi:hypothetical protein
MCFDIEGIPTNHEIFDLVNRGFDGFGKPIERCLSNPMNPLVCLRAGKEPVFSGIAYNVGLDVSNAHYFAFHYARNTRCAAGAGR